MQLEYDVFISHASENKAEVALPLAKLLKQNGVRVWLDSFELRLGDSLRRNIDLGLAGSRFGIVILSPEFFRKEWPQRELDGLAARESGLGKVILPIWHNITHDEIVKYSPTLADRLAVSTTNGLEHVAQQVLHVIREDPAPQPPPAPRPAVATKKDIQSPTVPTVRDRIEAYGEAIGPFIAAGIFLPWVPFLFVYLLFPSDFSSRFELLPSTLPGFALLGITYFFLGILCGYKVPHLKWKSGLALSLILSAFSC